MQTRRATSDVAVRRAGRSLVAASATRPDLVAMHAASAAHVARVDLHG